MFWIWWMAQTRTLRQKLELSLIELTTSILHIISWKSLKKCRGWRTTSLSLRNVLHLITKTPSDTIRWSRCTWSIQLSYSYSEGSGYVDFKGDGALAHIFCGVEENGTGRQRGNIGGPVIQTYLLCSHNWLGLMYTLYEMLSFTSKHNASRR